MWQPVPRRAAVRKRSAAKWNYRLDHAAPVFHVVCYTESGSGEKATRRMIRRKQLSVIGLACLALVTSVSQAHHRTHHSVRVRTDEPDLRSSSALVLDSTHS